MYSGARQPFASRTNAGPSTSAQPAEVTRYPIRAGKYPHRLNFYERPPVEEITLEEFETWAIDRLRGEPTFSTRCKSQAQADGGLRAVLADIESAQARNKPQEELKALVNARLKTYLPLSSDSTKGVDLDAERRKDHYSHFVLRLAFCRS